MRTPARTRRAALTAAAAVALTVALATAAAPAPEHRDGGGAEHRDGCAGLVLVGPSGAVRTGCAPEGRGAADGSPLRLGHAVADVRDVTVDGPGTVVGVAAPGAVGVVTFDGAAGAAVLVEVDAASPALGGCGVVELLAPDGASLASGCVRGGQGTVDATTLPATGRYAVVVDPADAGTGTARVRLASTVDQVGPLTLGGPPVDVRLERAGSVARLPFAATAGQVVVVQLSGATLADQCEAVRLLGPDGREVRSGCLLDGAGELRHRVAGAGEHVVVVDPRARETGTVTVGVSEG